MKGKIIFILHSYFTCLCRPGKLYPLWLKALKISACQTIHGCILMPRGKKFRQIYFWLSFQLEIIEILLKACNAMEGHVKKVRTSHELIPRKSFKLFIQGLEFAYIAWSWSRLTTRVMRCFLVWPISISWFTGKSPLHHTHELNPKKKSLASWCWLRKPERNLH